MRAPFAAAARGIASRPRHCARRPGGARSRRTPAGSARPSLQRGGELPGEIGGVADAGVHAEPAGRDHEMHGVAGEEHAAVAVAVGAAAGSASTGRHRASRISPASRRSSRTSSPCRHRCSTTACSVKCLVESCTMRNVARLVGDVIVAALADRDALVEILAIDRAPGAAAADCLRRASLMPSCVRTVLEPPSQPTRYAARSPRCEPSRLRTGAVTTAVVLRERHELAAVAHRDARQRFGDRFQQRLERVLRDELIGLERQRAVVASRRSAPCASRDRRIRQMQQRRLDHRAAR